MSGVFKNAYMIFQFSLKKAYAVGTHYNHLHIELFLIINEYPQYFMLF